MLLKYFKNTGNLNMDCALPHHCSFAHSHYEDVAMLYFEMQHKAWKALKVKTHHQVSIMKNRICCYTRASHSTQIWLTIVQPTFYSSRTDCQMILSNREQDENKLENTLKISLQLRFLHWLEEWAGFGIVQFYVDSKALGQPFSGVEHSSN